MAKFLDLTGLSYFLSKLNIPKKTSDLVNDSGFITSADVSAVTGVKGNSESSYRTGNVNITKANIGLGSVENKSSATIRGELTSSNVTTALGFTPYNSTNPSGYQANVIESVKRNGTALTITNKSVDITVPTKTSELTNDSGYITNAGVTGVKGNSETSYRTGNVNITKANIGLGNVENKSSATIRGELTSSNVTTALGFTPVSTGAISSSTTSTSTTNVANSKAVKAAYDHAETVRARADCVCYANSRVDTFSNGQITLSSSTLGITTGSKPVGILLTPEYGNAVIMKYNYDSSSSSSIIIQCWNHDGTAYSGAMRYFCVVYQHSWTQTIN